MRDAIRWFKCKLKPPKKGLELLKLLRKNDNIKLNKKGEICYKGKLLKKIKCL